MMKYFGGLPEIKNNPDRIVENVLRIIFNSTMRWISSNTEGIERPLLPVVFVLSPFKQKVVE